ncbi:MAG: type II toxin-antitoxin system HicA family toxin [Clostridia bacterium]|nr:type II toxin-antitoxin system HicA family toxin [Clostridia bacterium]
MKIYSSMDVLRILYKDGWYIKRQHGSHLQLVNELKKGKATLPYPRKSLDPKTVGSIFMQAGIIHKEP